MPPRIKAPGSNVPVQAVHPMRGGSAPTTEPTQVLTILRRFNGVYTVVYRINVEAPE